MRIKELDYLKGVMIILVITFHLVYFEHLYPYAKQVVYTFHMPVFLLISGYLMNISKKWGAFLLTIVGLVIPYLVMESGYIVMASLLPINEHIDHLTVGLFFDKLLLRPLGPYWYLHTLILCGLTYRLIMGTVLRDTVFFDNWMIRIIPMILVFYFFSHVLGLLSFSSVFPCNGICYTGFCAAHLRTGLSEPCNIGRTPHRLPRHQRLSFLVQIFTPFGLERYWLLW